jgi:lipopolysaccharide/colanic/teichoic acid biosynthesis glycosyltransferase
MASGPGVAAAPRSTGTESVPISTMDRVHPVERKIFPLVALTLPWAVPAQALAATDAGGDGFLGKTLGGILIGLAAVVGIAVLVAVVEFSVRLARERRAGDLDYPVVSVIYAHRLYGRVLYGFAPTAVGTAVTFIRTQEVSSAAAVFAAMLLTAAILRSARHPLHLMPVARYAFNAFVPAAGIGVVLLPGLFGSSLIGPATAAAALSTAVATTVIAAWLENRFVMDRPVRLAVIGPSNFTEKLASELSEAGIHGYQVVGYLEESEPADARSGVRWLGRLQDVHDVVTQDAIDLLVVSPENPRLPVFEQAARASLDLPVRMIEATALYEDVLGHVPIGTINSAWFQFIMHPRYSPASPVSKRVLDLVASALMVTIALPLILLSALAIRLEDGGPVFYRQRRVGEQGVEFDMLKFRTLAPDADERLADGVPEDQLVSRVGRLLRLTHLNELPQLVQVLRGAMSLVGPRPEPPALVEELADLVPYYERRALVKPGLTGWAQVRCGYAGSHFGTAWKMCHDLYYIKHRSATFDMLVLVQTLRTLVERGMEEEQLPAEDFILGDAAELVPR